VRRRTTTAGPAQSTGEFVTLASHVHASIPAWYQKGQGVLGWMVVSLDDRNGAAQADLVRVGDTTDRMTPPTGSAGLPEPAGSAPGLRPGALPR
jgi:hypothetical protein